MFVHKFEGLFVSIGLLLLILLVFLAAVLRFFGIDMSWSTDLAQLTFAWVCFIGADLALSVKRHMGVDMLIERFPIKVQTLIRLINSILILVFLAFVTVYGVNLSIVNSQRSFQTLPISYSFATASAPFGCSLMIITIIKQIIEYTKALKIN
ncbi:TRAP transporter small permease subunit [uncultured Sphaerochaeta sp.]|uniref:TRAP transporter small permease n=1 Tax=uncultured Sphaerochaeta sp. TaxID=886478 RepID=UPI002A0A1383|nr:TRAP transporter small permease subunit [uncultured Sphaerochaeta sp.]